MKRYNIIIFNILLPFVIHINAMCQTAIYSKDFINWPGRESSPKNKIEIKDSFVSKYNMTLAKGFTKSYVFYKIPLSHFDSLKKGRLEIRIFSSPVLAQMALVEFLDCISSSEKPKIITDEVHKHGDVEFRQEFGEITWLAFTSRNILIIINAPSINAIILANEMEAKIKMAPDKQENDGSPIIIFDDNPNH